MTRPSSIPADLWNAIPPNLQPAIAAVVVALENRVAELETRLNQNSSNSSRPPSSDPPHAKPAPPKTPSGKKRGGQFGHPKNQRTLLPPDVVVPLKPQTCRHCSHTLAGDDPHPLVHQVHEVPEIRPHVIEYRQHRLVCPHCQAVTCAARPADAVSGFGPRAQAITALLAGGHRLGKRGISQLMGDVFGLSISPAAVCDLQAKTAAALEPIHREALQFTRTQPAHVDETGWKQGRLKAWLWAAVTTVVAAFVIRRHRNRDAFHDLVGPKPPVLTTDRFSVYSHLPHDQRQVCWAHLRRDFQAMIDRKNEGSATGEELLAHTDILFEHWQRVRDGTLTRSGFRSRYASWLRREVRSLLERGSVCGCAKTSATCGEILMVEASLWTFASTANVEPTNNAAERALRHAVCWRKTSYGTDSESGSRFVERVLTVVASCRMQGRNVLGFLVEAIQASRKGNPTPSLLPTGV